MQAQTIDALEARERHSRERARLTASRNRHSDRIARQLGVTLSSLPRRREGRTS